MRVGLNSLQGCRIIYLHNVTILRVFSIHYTTVSNIIYLHNVSILQGSFIYYITGSNIIYLLHNVHILPVFPIYYMTQVFVIKELPFNYKDRRMEDVSSNGVTLLLQEGMAWRGFVIRKFYIMLQRESVWQVFVTREFHIC